MADGLQRVIVSGRTLKGISREDALERLAALFRTAPAEVEKYLSGRPLVIKGNLKPEQAARYLAALREAGVQCKAEPMPQRPPLRAHGAPAERRVVAEGKQAAARGGALRLASEHRVVSPESARESVFYAPIIVNHISAAEGGIDMNRAGMPPVAFGDIVLLSSYGTVERGEQRTRLLIFIRGSRRPYLADGTVIRYGGFEGVSAETRGASLRNFIVMLMNANPEMAVDRQTMNFISGAQPVPLEKSETAICTALGRWLEAEGLLGGPGAVRATPAAQADLARTEVPDSISVALDETSGSPAYTSLEGTLYIPAALAIALPLWHLYGAVEPVAAMVKLIGRGQLIAASANHALALFDMARCVLLAALAASAGTLFYRRHTSAPAVFITYAALGALQALAAVSLPIALGRMVPATLWNTGVSSRYVPLVPETAWESAGGLFMQPETIVAIAVAAFVIPYMLTSESVREVLPRE